MGESPRGLPSHEQRSIMAERETQRSRALQLFAATRVLRQAIGSPGYAFNEEEHVTGSFLFDII